MGVIFALLVAIPGFTQTPPTADQSQGAQPSSRVQDQQPKPETLTEPLSVLQPLTVKADTRSPVPNQAAHFTVTSNPQLDRAYYRFEWGDGETTETEQTMADHAYSAPGQYTVRVSAVSQLVTAHILPIKSNELTINVMALPVLTIAADNENPVASQQVHFRVTSDKPLRRVNYHFEWGDGETTESEQTTADHAYSAAGRYTVLVRAEAKAIAARRAAITSNELIINVAPQVVQRVLRLAADPLHARVGDQVKFTATLDPPEPYTRYHFVFEDGTEADSYRNEIVHSYKDAGDFRPTVFATFGSYGEKATSEVILLRINAPTATASATATPQPTVATKGPKKKAEFLTVELVTKRPTAGSNVIVTAQLHFTKEKNVIYEFDWADGSGPEVVPGGQGVHQYARAGRYTVTVSASTTETYPVPLTKSSTTVGVGWLFWFPPRVYWLPALGIALVGVLAWRLIGRRRPGGEVASPSPALRAVPYPVAGVHEMTRIQQTGPHASLTLKPGMDPGEDRIIFRESAAAD